MDEKQDYGDDEIAAVRMCYNFGSYDWRNFHDSESLKFGDRVAKDDSDCYWCY